MTDDFTPGQRWSIDLWPPAVIVLYDWLVTVDFGAIPVGHKAQKQALADLLTALETQAPVAGATQAQIDRARHDISEDMDWE